MQDYDSETASITNLGQSTFVDFIPGEDEQQSGDPKVQPGGNLWGYMNNLKRYLILFVFLSMSLAFTAAVAKTLIFQSINQSINQFLCREISHKQDYTKYNVPGRQDIQGS